MSTEERQRASRENGALSRGPKTAEGKKRSSQNAVRHGILARTIVLDEEDAEAFKATLRALQIEMAPRTENEAAMIETAAASRWRLMRVWALEREALRLEMEKYDASEQPPAERATLAFRSLSEETRLLDVLHRYEVRYNRQYLGALREFVALRAKLRSVAAESGPVREGRSRHGTFRTWTRVGDERGSSSSAAEEHGSNSLATEEHGSNSLATEEHESTSLATEEHGSNSLATDEHG